MLRKVAAEIGRIVSAGGNPVDTLRRYAEILEPWAESVSSRIVGEVDRQDARTWRARTKEMSLALRRELDTADTGSRMRALMAEQVKLIKSLPVEAAQEVHKAVTEGPLEGTRASDVAKHIEGVTESRATLIARTEVGRAKTALTQARAEHIGSDGYIWRTSKDADVRHSHRKMEGKFVPWDKPPTLDNLTGHAGALPNCRCYPEPVIPEID